MRIHLRSCHTHTRVEWCTVLGVKCFESRTVQFFLKKKLQTMRFLDAARLHRTSSGALTFIQFSCQRYSISNTHGPTGLLHPSNGVYMREYQMQSGLLRLRPAACLTCTTVLKRERERIAGPFPMARRAARAEGRRQEDQTPAGDGTDSRRRASPAPPPLRREAEPSVVEAAR